MKTYRLNRLFNSKSGRCFDVAIDHGFFNQPGFLTGIEDMAKAVETVVKAAPDAVQLTTGQARHLQQIPGRQKPSLVLRTDVANIYGRELPVEALSAMIEEPSLQAVRLDAACMCVNLFQIPGAPGVTNQCIENICALKLESDHYCMPMMVEPLVFRPNSEAGGYMVDGDVVKIQHLVRQAVELGADIIKADPTDDVSIYHKVVEAEILARTEALMQQGVSGIVYGRNVVQHQNPAGMVAALMAIVHDGATATEAAKFLK
jgi:DhnA family fructose-bisphosphate aldolase class Ia